MKEIKALTALHDLSTIRRSAHLSRCGQPSHRSVQKFSDEPAADRQPIAMSKALKLIKPLPKSVLFLDLDDVLIVPAVYKIKNRRRVRDGRKVHYAFLPQGRKLLDDIFTRCPDTAVVISSTWRMEGKNEVSAIFRLNGCVEALAKFHDDWSTCAPRPDRNRASEIADWLARHPEITQAAALDDDFSISGQPWAIIVDSTIGLSETDAAAAVALLCV